MVHPKAYQDAFVSDDEMSVLESTEKRFNKTTIALLRGGADALRNFPNAHNVGRARTNKPEIS